MTLQYNVNARLELLTTPPIIVNNLDGQGLTIEWTVDKRRGPSPDTATITVWNLAEVHRSTLRVFVGFPAALSVRLYIGFSGIAPPLPELVIDGQAVGVSPERSSGGPDKSTTINVGDATLSLRDTPPQGGGLYALGISTKLIVLLQALNMRPSPAALVTVATKAADLPIQSFDFTGDRNPRDMLDDLMASLGLSWGNDGGLFVVYEGGIRYDVPAVILGPTTGLLSLTEREDGGFDVEALANPRVVPGGQIQLVNSLLVPVAPPVRVDSVSFRGSTRGPSLMSIKARTAAPITAPLPEAIDPFLA